MGPTWVSVARVLQLRIPIAWQEAVHVARAALLASESRSCRLTLEGCLISTDGQVRVGEQGADRIGAALSELQLLNVLLDGQKVPRELSDILASADDALSGFPSEEDPSPRGLSLEWFVGTEPAAEIARLAARAVDADRGIVPAPPSRRTPTHPLGTDYEPPPFGGRPPSGSGVTVAAPPRPDPAPPMVPVPPPVPPVPPTAPRDALAAFPLADSPGREPAPALALEALPRGAPPQIGDSRERDDWRLEWLIARASAAASDLRRVEPVAVGVAAGVMALAAAVVFAWLGSAPVPPLESRALAGVSSYAPTVAREGPSASPAGDGAGRGVPGASPAAAVPPRPPTIGLVARSSGDAAPMRLTPTPAAASAAPAPAVASFPASARPPGTAASLPSSRPADAGTAAGTASSALRLYSAEDADVEPPVWRRPQLPSEPKADSEPTDSFVELIVNEQGEVAQVRLYSSDMSLNDRMIIAAVKAWQFRPAMKDGRPVRYMLRMPVTR